MRLLIVDPSLKDTAGHHFAVTDLVIRDALEAGVTVHVLANREVDKSLFMRGVGVSAVFKETTYTSTRYIKSSGKMTALSAYCKRVLPYRIKKHIKRIFMEMLSDQYLALMGIYTGKEEPHGVVGMDSELNSGLKELDANSEDILLVHTSDARTYRVILDYILNYYNSANGPSIHLSTPYDMSIMPHRRQGLSVKRVVNYYEKMGLIGHKIFLYAENELLSKELTDEWGVSVQPLELPIPQLSEKLASDNNGVTVAYLGAAREEKGFHLLPDIVKRVLVRSPDNVRFVIQCSPQIVGYSSIILAAIDELKSMSGDCLTLIEEKMSMSQYYDVLANTDVVLLCYNKGHYRTRSSGIAVEAVSLGKLIIATPGTFPAWVAGEAALLANDAGDASRAIIDVLDDKESYMARAKARMYDYLGSVSVNYVEPLIENHKKYQNKHEYQDDFKGIVVRDAAKEIIDGEEFVEADVVTRQQRLGQKVYQARLLVRS